MKAKARKDGFRMRLAKRQIEANSLVCIGIDPLEKKLPEPIFEKFAGVTTEAMMLWLMKYVDATAPFASMFKPQRAYFEGMRQCDGIAVLRFIVAYIQYHYPSIPIFLDCKRGDILRTQQQYGVAHLILDAVDGMNFSPYMGSECMEGLSEISGNIDSVVSLCYTSNESARETQEVLLADGRQYWEYIADLTLNWAKKLGVVENAGLVMAAAYERPKKSGHIFTWHLKRGREIVENDLWFLIPGIGTQGGFVLQTVKYAFSGPGSMAMNSSSELLFASNSADFAEASAGKAEELRDHGRACVGNTD